MAVSYESAFFNRSHKPSYGFDFVAYGAGAGARARGESHSAGVTGQASVDVYLEGWPCGVHVRAHILLHLHTPYITSSRR